MSKYKVGDQIYVKCIVVGISDEDDPIIKLANWGNHIAVSEEEICAETYEDGLNDAWKAARMIYENPDRIREIFDNPFVDDILNSHAPQAIVAKIKAYEDSKEIRRGDEVIYKEPKDKESGIVTLTHEEDKGALVLWQSGNASYEYQDSLTKTGRNFADRLDALLSGIGGGKNE